MMPDQPYDGYDMTRAEKARLNRIAYWRSIRDQADAMLRQLGDEPKPSPTEIEH